RTVRAGRAAGVAEPHEGRIRGERLARAAHAVDRGDRQRRHGRAQRGDAGAGGAPRAAERRRAAGEAAGGGAGGPARHVPPAPPRRAGEPPALAPLRIELSWFTEEVAAALRSRAPHRTIEVLAPPQLDIVTDPTLLYRILYNLGDNALKYSDDEVRFTVRSD